MMKRLIAPVDGSDVSWRAADVALSLARRFDAVVNIVEVVFAAEDVRPAEARLANMLGERDTDGIEVYLSVEQTDGPAGARIEQLVRRWPEATVVMASHGRGRSAALLGSVTEEVLHTTFGPVLVVGPHVSELKPDGPVVVSVDGSEESETALPLAAAWAIELGVAPWVVHVAKPGAVNDSHMPDSAYVAGLARDLSHTSAHRVEFEELHDGHPERSVPEFAASLNASVIVATTHGRTGLSRLTAGSVASGFVRHATCPVLMQRLPHSASN